LNDPTIFLKPATSGSGLLGGVFYRAEEKIGTEGLLKEIENLRKIRENKK